MAPAFVGTPTNATEAATATTLVVTRTTVAGNLLVLFVNNDNGGTITVLGPTVSTIIDSNGIHWELNKAFSQTGGVAGAQQSQHLECFYLPGAPAITSVTLTFTATTFASAQLFEISNADTLDKAISSGAAGTASAWDTGATGTTTLADAAVIGGACIRGGTAITPTTAGYTASTLSASTGTNPVALNTGYKIVSATGAQDLAGTFASVKNNAKGLVVFIQAHKPGPPRIFLPNAPIIRKARF